MIYIVVFFLSVVLTYYIREFAKKKAILDIPNQRSSHLVATPRGGGVAIVISFFIGLIYFYFIDEIELKLFLALLCSIPILFISILDDIGEIDLKIRFFVQLFSVIMALFFLGGVDKIDFIFFTIEGFWVNIFVTVCMMWLINLYNFLDGIDGYAASEALFVGVCFYLLFGNSIGLLIAFASLGFLIFNWQRASIFMGDVGSTFLGFLFGVLCFYDTSSGNIYIWLIILSLFWFDATVTLFKRVLNKENFFQAHKKHAFQRLTQVGFSHQKVVLYAMGINLIFLTLLLIIKKPFLPILFLTNIIILSFLYKYIDKIKEF